MRKLTRRFADSVKLLTVVAIMSIGGHATANEDLTTIEHYVDHVSVDGFYTRNNIDPEISLYVREVVAEGGIESAVQSEKVIILVHGGTFPSEVAFDLDYENASLMRQLAKMGWDVFALDLEGYGRSTRPAVMDTPDAWPNEPAPISPDVTLANVSTVVDFVRDLRGVDKVHMLGWSAGATLEVPRYAAEHGDKLHKVILYGVLYRNDPLTEVEIAEKLAANNASKNRMGDPAATDRWAGLGTEVDMVIPGLFDVYTPAHLASDPLAAKNDNKIRAPWGRFSPYYTESTMLEPDKITVPTLVIRGEFDTYATSEDNQALVDALRVEGSQLITIAGGGHFLHMEKVNTEFYAALEKFLIE